MRKRANATFDDAKEMTYEIMEAARHFEPWPMHVEGDFHESELSGVWLLDFWIDGDWKHDHWAFNSQVQELYPFLLYKGERVTEDNGSDWYTAVHQFAFAGKDIDLNAMSRLFASKKGKKAIKKRAYLDGYDITIYRVEVTPIDSENLIAEYGEYENIENAIDKANFVASEYINKDEERAAVVEYTFHADDMEWECGGIVYECEF